MILASRCTQLCRTREGRIKNMDRGRGPAAEATMQRAIKITMRRIGHASERRLGGGHVPWEEVCSLSSSPYSHVSTPPMKSTEASAGLAGPPAPINEPQRYP